MAITTARRSRNPRFNHEWTPMNTNFVGRLCQTASILCHNRSSSAKHAKTRQKTKEWLFRNSRSLNQLWRHSAYLADHVLV
jgi:hypothetical protein